MFRLEAGVNESEEQKHPDNGCGQPEDLAAVGF